MASLHLSKVAVGCATIEALSARVAARAEGGVVPVVTRLRPKRAGELVGGSLYWIVRHRLTARQAILGFAEREGDRRTIIRLDGRLIPVRAQPMRAHQGWRYLASAEAPDDLDNGDGLAALPAPMADELARLALV